MSDESHDVSTPGKKPVLQDRILEHSYDGIQEYDNPMPRWWLLTFAGTVIFAILYLFNIGPIGNGKGRIADYEADMKAFAAAHPSSTGNDITPAALLALVGKTDVIELGRQTFVTNCVSCHRADGGGLIGPNLADKYWLHGSSLSDIYHTVNNGVLDKGMPPWGKILKPAQVQAVTAYVSTMQGTNPANPKAPQGTIAQP
ncbi:MAG: cbb3-type cytochrome c oxidase N-terminal domain-containing protein [Gemmatimonadaceae bacterium]